MNAMTNLCSGFKNLTLSTVSGTCNTIDWTARKLTCDYCGCGKKSEKLTDTPKVNEIEGFAKDVIGRLNTKMFLWKSNKNVENILKKIKEFSTEKLDNKEKVEKVAAKVTELMKEEFVKTLNQNIGKDLVPNFIKLTTGEVLAEKKTEGTAEEEPKTVEAKKKD